MTAVTVLYLRSNGLVLGALTTAVAADPPAVDPAVTLTVAVPPPPSQGSTIDPAPVPVAFTGSEVSVAVLEAEFSDPAEIFQWRVTTTPGPDGSPKPRLDRLATGRIKAVLNEAKTAVTLTVPRLGSATTLAFDIRSEAGRVKAGPLDFSGDGDKDFPIDLPSLPEGTELLVAVEGYATATVKVPVP